VTTGGTGEGKRSETSLRLVGSGGLERILRPIHHWVWASPRRRAYKLFGFAATEADSGRDMARAAECTRDPLLRRLYLRHSLDEQRHARLFSARGSEILATLASQGTADGESPFRADWLSPGERGLDDLEVEGESDASLLAFLFLAERAGARRFVEYQRVLSVDPETRDVFRTVLRDEAFHTNYSFAQLARVAPGRRTLHVWWARLGRLWRAYLRLASVIAGVFGAVVLTVQYFVVLPLFALLAARSARREPVGWTPARALRPAGLRKQY
jgi:hypothetical protein